MSKRSTRSVTIPAFSESPVKAPTSGSSAASSSSSTDSAPIQRPNSEPKAMTIPEFMDAVKSKFPREYNESVQTLVYFRTVLDVHQRIVTSLSGMDYNYAVIRPQAIVFVSANNQTRKTSYAVKVKEDDIAPFKVNGIQFQTNVSKKEWDAEHKRYSNIIKMDSDGKPMMKVEYEIKYDCTMNHLQIVNASKTFTKPKGRFDLFDEVHTYYDWRVAMDRNDAPLVKAILPHIKDTEAFTPLFISVTSIDPNDASDDDIDIDI